MTQIFFVLPITEFNLVRKKILKSLGSFLGYDLWFFNLRKMAGWFHKTESSIHWVKGGGGLKWNLSGGVTPPKFNMEPENCLSKRKIIFQTPFLGFHVHFPGCSVVTFFPWNIVVLGRLSFPCPCEPWRPPFESYGTFVEHFRGEFLSQNLARK